MTLLSQYFLYHENVLDHSAVSITHVQAKAQVYPLQSILTGAMYSGVPHMDVAPS
jgi:hypothetical protein